MSRQPSKLQIMWEIPVKNWF